MLTCYEDFIGIKSCNTIPEPSSGLFIEDLVGIDKKRVANIASDSSGIELIQKCILQACDQTLEDVLNYAPDNGSPILFSSNQVSRYFPTRKTRKESFPASNTLRKVTFELKNPQKASFSKIFIKSISLITNVSAVKTFQILENGVVKNSININTQNGVLIREEVNHLASGYSVDIQATFADMDTVRFYVPFAECFSCGGNKKYYDERTGLYIFGTDAFSVEVFVQCDIDSAKCALLPYLKYAIFNKAGILLATEGKFTDRGNFYVFRTDFQELVDYFQKEYDKRLRQAFPTIKNILKNSDPACFECKGVKLMNTSI